MEVKLRLTRKRVGLFVALLALVVAGVAVAASAITSNAYTDAQGVYHGCVNSSNGNLRVVVPGDACKNNEVAIDWNQSGAQGPKGDKGDQGIQGIQGTQGLKGDQGIQGIQGLKGDKGDKGDPGAGGLSGYEIVHSDAVTTTDNGLSFAKAVCPAGKKVVGGGWDFSSSTGPEDLTVLYNGALNDNDWIVEMEKPYQSSNPVGMSLTYRAEAICVSA